MIPRWITPGHRKSLVAMSDVPAVTPIRNIPSRRAQLEIVENLLDQTSAGFFAEYHDIFVSHPFTHRPLMEFCLAVPVSQLLLNGQPRSLMRRSLRDLVPAKIAQRVSKGLLDEALARAAQREWSSVGDLGRWQLCERGVVDPTQLSKSLQKARLGLQMTNENLVRVLSMERWLRSLDSFGGRRLNRTGDLVKSLAMAPC